VAVALGLSWTNGLRIRRRTRQAIGFEGFLNWPAPFRAFSVQTRRNGEVSRNARKYYLIRGPLRTVNHPIIRFPVKYQQHPGNRLQQPHRHHRETQVLVNQT
jgi:hypothetical protein